eukprot:2630881-Rhodomonas_salina.1
MSTYAGTEAYPGIPQPNLEFGKSGIWPDYRLQNHRPFPPQKFLKSEILYVAFGETRRGKRWESGSRFAITFPAPALPGGTVTPARRDPGTWVRRDGARYPVLTPGTRVPGTWAVYPYQPCARSESAGATFRCFNAFPQYPPRVGIPGVPGYPARGTVKLNLFERG